LVVATRGARTLACRVETLLDARFFSFQRFSGPKTTYLQAIQRRLVAGRVSRVCKLIRDLDSAWHRIRADRADNDAGKGWIAQGSGAVPWSSASVEKVSTRHARVGAPQLASHLSAMP
jgi:hypothetical protein